MQTYKVKNYAIIPWNECRESAVKWEKMYIHSSKINSWKSIQIRQRQGNAEYKTKKKRSAPGQKWQQGKGREEDERSKNLKRIAKKQRSEEETF